MLERVLDSKSRPLVFTEVFTNEAFAQDHSFLSLEKVLIPLRIFHGLRADLLFNTFWFSFSSLLIHEEPIDHTFPGFKNCFLDYNESIFARAFLKIILSIVVVPILEGGVCCDIYKALRGIRDSIIESVESSNKLLFPGWPLWIRSQSYSSLS